MKFFLNDGAMTEGASTRQTFPEVMTINSGQHAKKELPEGTREETKERG